MAIYTLAPQYLWVPLDFRMEVTNPRGERLKPGGLLEYQDGRFSLKARWVKEDQDSGEYLVEFACGSRCWVSAAACVWIEPESR
jgi:hypothetical protein